MIFLLCGRGFKILKLRWSGNVKLMGINSSLGKMKAGSLELSKEHLFLANSIISAMKVLF